MLMHASLISIIVAKCKSRDHLTSFSTTFLIWLYFVWRHYCQVFSGNIILHLPICRDLLASRYNIMW